ncbi:hypothetical protein EYB31_13190 [Paenibacillus thalictri]|uniref:Uncharacterized protein n=1 Tax=Paenibacillus thalictri TaxID=2527873 RepID=A0A4Q9DPY5_9BACL|nr:hypothetical protein [Paenibacillus thalictri]TBL78458.1 hypothetical protein EYB31_13190 [Paenibacillus thalictri]
MDVTVEPQEIVRKKRGRPRQGEIPAIDTIYVLQIAITPDEVRFRKRGGGRPALYWQPPCRPSGGEKRWRGRTALLGLYKGQIHMNFSFLKDPVYTDEIYLKKPGS